MNHHFLYNGKKIYFISGKGGTGKTYLSAHFAKSLAASGKKVLLAESGPYAKLSTYFTNYPIEHAYVEHSPHLFIANLSYEGCLKDYIASYLGVPAIYERLVQSSMLKSFLKAVPGLYDCLLLGKLYHLLTREKDPFDVIIFDSKASGHFLSFITTPEKVLKSKLTGPFVKEVEKVLNFLRDFGSIIFLAIPEELSVTETLEFVPQIISQTEMPVHKIVLNRFFADLAESLPSQEPPSPYQSFAKIWSHERKAWQEELVCRLISLGYRDKLAVLQEDINWRPQVELPQLKIITDEYIRTVHCA